MPDHPAEAGRPRGGEPGAPASPPWYVMLVCYDRLGMPAHSDEWRRALEVLANSPEGATEALLFAHGFMYETITGLVDSGLAISTTGPTLAGGRLVEVTRITITYRGRVALERRAKPPER
jgi:hypothetical protein